MPDLACEKCDDFYLLRDGAAGIFLAASQFPKHRETRAPLVEEILTVAEQLDDKYKFLASAPTQDPDGNKAVVRFLRKTREQYVMSERDGKPSGWRALYQGGKWVEEQTKARKAPARGAARKKAAARKAPVRRKKAAKRKKAARASKPASKAGDR